MMDEANTYPILARGANDPIAFIGKELSVWPGFSGEVSAADFLAQVHFVAECLPQHQYVINLCDNRYLFTVIFCAAILRGQINLLPPNKKELTQERLQQRYGDVYIAHDGVSEEFPSSLPQFALRELDLSQCLKPQQASPFSPPRIPLEQLAAISFTSGSTGDSQAIQKSWRTVVESSKINANHMLEGYTETLYQLATVPPQHMWGLETSVLLPLFNSICVLDTKPLFPQDILDQLKCLPEPRMLVSAPVHLRALCVSQLNFPTVDLVLCATSPLSVELAKQAETLFAKGAQTGAQTTTSSSELREVYGCSEVGSMAVRTTASEESWQLFHGITLDPQGSSTIASTAYLPEAIVLQDRIVVAADGRFTLGGRDSDMVDIAGKRGSLLELNKTLLNYPGIIDGVIFIPQAQNANKTVQNRLAAMVVLSEGSTIQLLRDYLGKHLDNAFIPRQILQVAALPREENGKLPLKRLNEYYQQLKSPKDS